MRRYSSSPALGNTVRLKLDSVTESLLRSATSRSGRSRGFEVFFRVRDHLNRFPMFRVMDNPDFSKSFFVTVRFDEETNLKLINAKKSKLWNEFKKRCFGIYLFHQQIIYLTIIPLNGKVPPIVQVMISFLCAVGVASIITAVLKRFKLTRILYVV